MLYLNFSYYSTYAILNIFIHNIIIWHHKLF